MMPEVQTSTMMMLTMMVLLSCNDDAAGLERKMQLRPAPSGVAEMAVGKLDEILRVREAKP